MFLVVVSLGPQVSLIDSVIKCPFLSSLLITAFTGNEDCYLCSYLSNNTFFFFSPCSYVGV